MATYEKMVDKCTVIEEDGTSRTTVTEKSITRDKFREPDYIKIYTNMWCEFNQIPMVYRQLFLELALRMTYCNSTKLAKSQLVSTGSPYKEDIMEACGWKSKGMYQKGLKALCECGAIKRINRGIYQINPSYAGKGKWLYDSKADQGGVKDLIATFNFKDKTVDTHIVWADDGEWSDESIEARANFGVKKDDEAIISYTTMKPTGTES